MKTTPARRLLLAATAAALLTGGAWAQAPAWPSKPIKATGVSLD
jgi:hypothetical protein